MTILITGATGFVGRALVARLVKEGERPRCLVRHQAQAAQSLPADQVELVEGDLLHPETFAAALQGIDVLVDSAFMTANLKQHGEETYYHVNVDGTHNLVDAAKRAGVGRAVVMSGLGTKADKPGSYMQGRYLAEEAIKQSGMGWSILQPSVQFGPRSAFFKGLADLIRQVPLVVPVAGSGHETFQPIWVEDVVTCTTKLIREPARDGHTYTVGGPDILTYNQILDLLMQTLHVKKTKLAAPKPFAFLGAAVMEALLPKPPLTVAALGLFDFPNTTDLDAVETQFGFKPLALSTYLAQYGVD
jgi:NADH dehydrogenase